MRRVIATAAFTLATLVGLNVLAQTGPTHPVFNPNTPGQPGPNDVRSGAPQGNQPFQQGLGGAGGAGGFGGAGPVPTSSGLVVPNVPAYGNLPASQSPASTRRYSPLAPIDHSAGAIDHRATAIDHVSGDAGL